MLDGKPSSWTSPSGGGCWLRRFGMQCHTYGLTPVARLSVIPLATLASLPPSIFLRSLEIIFRNKKALGNKGLREVPSGVEPLNHGFAIRCLSHLATEPNRI